MAVSANFIEQAKDLFHPFGEIRVRRMFGGAGVYCNDLFFAIMDDGAIYFKADDDTRGAFEQRGLAPFTFEMKDGRIEQMSYYAAPEEIFDDEDDLKRWTTLALDAAKRATKFRKRSRNSAQDSPRPAASRRSARKRSA